jgi:hypothetical protein
VRSAALGFRNATVQLTVFGAISAMLGLSISPAPLAIELSI